MILLDKTDRALIAALQSDARQSVTALAGLVGVSRVTAQTRLQRLQDTGVIRKFTIELGEVEDRPLIKAVMFIALTGAMTRRVIHILNANPAITDLHTTNGAWDLVAHITTASLPEFDRVLRQVREIEGVSNSETCLLLDQACP